MPEKDRTNDGDFEYIEYHHFEAVPYARLMSWKGGEGSINWGHGGVIRKRASEPLDDQDLPKDTGVLVMKADFKLVPK
ncbi:hypothetical protein BFJ66_g15914 [Fusarium oxysporum f. sp. cepae]|uniref:Uncharacterized protein n=1 Tax=Fusarium oxysporum f. sp. cepae TaxID=396571 RepID=A0A3L6N135_FUSOX|nr:hypothetical protein BFJ65_g14534 [Fusarium oxysporum f. sp. cepae]RKK26990.1 hypothetical protein BFJ67_g16357 [Fusarium oxysporum f. sp. cepae]RKK31286.1 hypothetical protein BFJ66_g15914 [Fusarium oxysporum f. sp. cepae]